MQFALLASVRWLSDRADSLGGLPSQRHVADHAETDVMMTSQVLRVLELRGLVTRTPDPDDARVRRLDVTEDGRRLADEAVAVVEAADDVFFAGTRDRPELLAALRRLSREEAGPPGTGGSRPSPS